MKGSGRGEREGENKATTPPVLSLAPNKVIVMMPFSAPCVPVTQCCYSHHLGGGEMESKRLSSPSRVQVLCDCRTSSPATLTRCRSRGSGSGAVPETGHGS